MPSDLYYDALILITPDIIVHIYNVFLHIHHILLHPVHHILLHIRHIPLQLHHISHLITLLFFVQKYADKVRPYVCDTVIFMHGALVNKKRILIEGANAMMLDIDFGKFRRPEV
jgi:hypothetical protein